MDCLPIPQFCLDFLLRSKTYSKEYPRSTSTANRDFPLTGLHTLQGANYTIAQWFIQSA